MADQLSIFRNMDFNFYYTLALFFILTFLLIKEIFPPEISIFSVLLLLLIGNVITVKEAFSGFSNEGMLTIGLLFAISGALQTTGIMNLFVNFILRGSSNKGIKGALTRLLLPLAFLSAFLNNTPIVAMLISPMKRWSEQNNIPVSKFLIPISYITILGGMCTLIGTSTNLIVHGLMIENGYPGFGFFELSLIGIPVLIAGLIYLLLFGHKLLPENKNFTQDFSQNIRDFVVELKVKPNYLGIGKTIEVAGLRHLKGLYLFQIERNSGIIRQASPDEVIQLDDRLFFTGLPQTILELQKTPGLEIIEDAHFDLKNYDSDRLKSYEVVVSSSSPLINQKIKESNFREKYNSVIVAIHRNGDRIKEKIGNIHLRAGDTLLLLSDKQFKNTWYNSKDFFLISDFNGVPSKPKWHSYFSAGVFILALILAFTGLVPLISAMGIATVVLVLSGTLSKKNVINSIDWKVLVIIASSFGIAMAIEKSGVGIFFADIILSVFSNFGVIGVISGIFITTAVYTNFITNNTAAVLMFPIALAIAQNLNMDIHPLAVAIAIGASASFASPISYQTNLMVYGPGGYRFTDFIKVGAPLQLGSLLLSVPIIYWVYFL
jgi:di/tricarboxylate transporter